MDKNFNFLLFSYIHKLNFFRTLKLVFEKELEVAGISAYRFIVPKEDFDFTLNENKGYCNEKSEKVFFNEHDKECLPNGLLDISRCQQGEFILAFKKRELIHLF